MLSGLAGESRHFLQKGSRDDAVIVGEQIPRFDDSSGLLHSSAILKQCKRELFLQILVLLGQTPREVRGLPSGGRGLIHESQKVANVCQEIVYGSAKHEVNYQGNERSQAILGMNGEGTEELSQVVVFREKDARWLRNHVVGNACGLLVAHRTALDNLLVDRLRLWLLSSRFVVGFSEAPRPIALYPNNGFLRNLAEGFEDIWPDGHMAVDVRRYKF